MARQRATPTRRLAALLLGLLAQTVVAAVPPLRLSDLAVALNRQPEAVRADFAAIAVSAMADAFGREAENADRVDDTRWAGGVDAYARQLRTIAAGIGSDTPVRIRLSPEHSLYLLIGGTPVIVSDPRVRRQKVLEQEILERFCGLHDCTHLAPPPAHSAAAGDAAPAPAAAPAMPSSVQWSFRQYKGPTCRTDDGLAFEFRSLRDLQAKRRVCQQVVAELDTLAARLAQYAAVGTDIDWQRIALNAVPDSDRQEIRLNPNNDMLVVRLPALSRTPALFARLRPWLAAKVAGHPVAVDISDAEQLLAPLLNTEAD